VALADNYAPRDAHIVTLLRQAGAVILGKLNMTEFANFMSTDNMPSGYSSRGGQVVNPYNKDITPSGSSSGSAVAVAAGLCPVTIGTETSGSILSPAVYNGVVGIKPTLGLVGRSGIIPISSTLDTAGPMAGSVSDAAALLGVIAGADPGDPATHTLYATTPANFTQDATMPGSHNQRAMLPSSLSQVNKKLTVHANKSTMPADYTKCLDPRGLSGLRIGINRAGKRFGDDAAISEQAKMEAEDEKAAFDNLLRVLSESGAQLSDNVNYDPEFKAVNIMHYEFKACMGYYLSAFGGKSKMHTLNDIILYNQANAATALKYGQGRLLQSENKASGTFAEPEYIGALLERERIITELEKLFCDNNLDIMLCENFNGLAPYTGFPAMTIPIGQRRDSLPIGSYWMARRYGEATLIKATYAAEQKLGLRLKPVLKQAP
jgi:amidase